MALDPKRYISFLARGGKFQQANLTPETSSAVVPVKIFNNSGSTLAAGDLLYVDDWNTVNSCVSVKKAQANAATTLAVLIADSTVADQAVGVGVYRKILSGVNTAGSAVGAPVYLSAATAGVWTLTAPTGSNTQQIVGTVHTVSATAGRVGFSLPALPLLGHDHSAAAVGGNIKTARAFDNVPPTGGIGGLLVIYAAFTAGPGGAPDDITIFAANCPRLIRIVRTVLHVTTAVAASTCTLRDATGGGGTALSDNISSAAAGEINSNFTAAWGTVPAGGSLYIRRSDNAVGGEVAIYCLPSA